MSLEVFYNAAVSVERLVKDEGESPEDTEEYRLTDLQNLPCLIYPLEDSFGEDIRGSYGKDYIMISGIQDILEKDKVVDQDDKEYVVVGVRAYSFMGTEVMETRIKQMPVSEES